MTRDLPALRRSITDRLPDFVKPRLAEFEAAIRAEYTGYTVRWDGSCWVARHSDNPTLSAAAMTPNEAMADLRMMFAAMADEADS